MGLNTFRTAYTMKDGTVLHGDLILPADASGKAIAKKFPVIVTITAYNKGVQGYAGGLAGGDPTDIAACKETYERLRPTTAQQVLRFHRMQQNAPVA